LSFLSFRDVRKALESRLSRELRRQTGLKAHRATLEASIQDLTRVSQDSEQQLKHVRQLIDRMAKLKGDDRSALRLSLRNQLRRLLTEIKVVSEDELHLRFATSQWPLGSVSRGIYVEEGKVRILDRTKPPKAFLQQG
jgi:multidrug efflux pump subunit AcrA (membrane-fusion protein)